MVMSNDDSSSGEEHEAREATLTPVMATPAPLPPASIDTIMARLA